MKFLRRLLLIIDWLSLILVPYSLLAYVCYLGICGGGVAAEVGARFTGFYGYFSWVYPLVVVTSLYISRIYNKKNRMKNAVYCLFFPVVCLLPLIYVEWQVAIIEYKHKLNARKSTTAHAGDHICSPGIFIRSSGKDGRYYVYNFDVKGDSGSVTAYQTRNELKTEFDLGDKGRIPITCREYFNKH